MKSRDSYTLLAPFYGRLMKSINYREWAEYARQVTKPFLPEAPDTLELAAGIGEFARHFKKNCGTLLLTDKSIDMLAARDAVKVDVIACDMIKIPFVHSSFDFVYCLFDSMNYLTSQKSFRAALNEVKRVLKPGGLFLFDCCLLAGSLEHMAKQHFSLSSSGINVQQTSSVDTRKMLHTNTFQFRLPDGSRVVEKHRQKIYPLDALVRMINASGFTILLGYKGFTFKDCGPDDKRVNFLVRK